MPKNSRQRFALAPFTQMASAVSNWTCSACIVFDRMKARLLNSQIPQDFPQRFPGPGIPGIITSQAFPSCCRRSAYALDTRALSSTGACGLQRLSPKTLCLSAPSMMMPAIILSSCCRESVSIGLLFLLHDHITFLDRVYPYPVLLLSPLPRGGERAPATERGREVNLKQLAQPREGK